MATIAANSFSSYTLTEQEEVQSAILNSLNLMRIQNKKSDIASQILNNEFDPEHPLKFTQQDAYLKGQLAVLDFLIESHDAAISSLQESSSTE